MLFNDIDNQNGVGDIEFVAVLEYIAFPQK
jgi:hypothetical protein